MQLQLTAQQSERMKTLMRSEHCYSEQDFFNTLLDNFEFNLSLNALKEQIEAGEKSGYQQWTTAELRESIINEYAPK